MSTAARLTLRRTGKVAQGALDLLAELPIQKVSVDELPRLVRDPSEYDFMCSAARG